MEQKISIKIQQALDQLNMREISRHDSVFGYGNTSKGSEYLGWRIFMETYCLDNEEVVWRGWLYKAQSYPRNDVYLVTSDDLMENKDTVCQSCFSFVKLKVLQELLEDKDVQHCLGAIAKKAPKSNSVCLPGVNVAIAPSDFN